MNGRPRLPRETQQKPSAFTFHPIGNDVQLRRTGKAQPLLSRTITGADARGKVRSYRMKGHTVKPKAFTDNKESSCIAKTS
jgi:hypothetical protein